MEEPVERKDAAVGIVVKEPLKTEGIVPSPDTSERSDGASSPPPNCSICLGKLRNTSFTDSCLHQFCFTCLLQWSKIKTECPLCKQTFKSIIHNVRSEEDYDQYHVPRELASQLPTQQITALDVNFELFRGQFRTFGGQIRRFVYRTTMTPNRRYGVLLNPEQVARQEQIPNVVPSVSREERRYRRLNSTGFRRNVYQQGEWSNFLPNIDGRLRECSAEYYRRNPHELNRLIPWINRELQILLNANDRHIAYVLNVITESLSRFDIRGPEFRDTVRPYFGPYTDHFAHELLNYARTSYDIVGYDQYVTYPSSRRGLSGEYVGRVVSPFSSVSSTSSDDSDVRVVDQTIDVSRDSVEIPSVGPHVIDMPGPSTVGETFQVPRITSAPDILTISSSASSSDDCEVVGYVKPRHERTPEIIELVSSDGGIEPTNNNVDANCRSPCESRDNECDRAGPSHEDRRRSVRKVSRRQRRSSNMRYSTSSGSNTNDESETEQTRRHRKKSCHRTKIRPRGRKTRTPEENGRLSPARSRSNTRRREISSPSSSLDLNRRRKLHRGIHARSQTFKQLGLVNTDSASESCMSKASRSVSANSRASSRSSSVRSLVTRVRKPKDRKDKLPKRSDIYSSTNSSSSNSSSSSSSSSSSLSSSSSSSSSVSDSETAWSGESTNRRQRSARSRRKTSCQVNKADSGQLASSYRRRYQQQPVNATILRKDSTKPNEWYVKKKSLYTRSRSRSSSSRRSESEQRTSGPRRTSNGDFKDRKDSILGNPGCSRKTNLSGRKKRETEIDSSASESRSDVTTGESNNRGNGISGRTRAKERSRHKDGPKRRRIRSKSSDSERSRPLGGSNSRRRDQESRSDQAKRKEQSKREDRGRKREHSSRTSDQTKRNDHDRNTDRNIDQELNVIDQSRKIIDNARKTIDQEKRKIDQGRKTADQDRKKVEQAVGNDCGRKINDHASRSNDARKKDHGKRNDEDLPSSISKHSENDKKSISKDKHKSKKKQKAKRRRSRSESKSESRNKRHRMERSSSYSTPTTHLGEQ